MKKLNTLFIIVIFITAFTSSQVLAQDVWKAAPKNAKLLCDSLGVKLIKASWKPGEEMPLHTHPARMIYVTKGGQLTVTHKEGGKIDVLDLKDGDAITGPAEGPHTTKNTGKGDVELILVEISK